MELQAYNLMRPKLQPPAKKLLPAAEKATIGKLICYHRRCQTVVSVEQKLQPCLQKSYYRQWKKLLPVNVFATMGDGENCGRRR